MLFCAAAICGLAAERATAALSPYVRSLRGYGSRVGLPSQLMPVLGQTAAAAARSFPRAQVGPPAGCRPTGKPVSGMLGHGPAP